MQNINIVSQFYYRNPNGSSRHNRTILEETEEKPNYHKNSTDSYNGSQVKYLTAIETGLTIIDQTKIYNY